MNSDHHFVIGRAHLVCEDYCASHDGFAALSDGCSVVKDDEGNVVDAHTDVGARLLVRAAFHHRDYQALSLVVNTADGYRRQMGLAKETLSATLVKLSVGSTGVWSSMAGDGMVAGRLRDWQQTPKGLWKWRTETVRFPRRPFYPLYLLLAGEHRRRCQDDNDRTMYIDTELETFELALTQPHVRFWHWDRYDLVVAASDGVRSFTRDGRPVEFTREFAERLLDFRRMRGRFMVRHLTGVLRELAAEGIVNQDDVSMIGVHNP